MSELERESMHAREERARAWHWQRAAEAAAGKCDAAVASGERAKAVREWGIVALFALFSTLLLWQGGWLGGFVEYIRGESEARVAGESKSDPATSTTDPVAGNTNGRSGEEAGRVAPGRRARRTRGR